MEIELPP
jgi:hypothetical protein